MGGTAKFDPSAEGRRVRAALTPGMTWQQVIGVAGEPKKYQTFVPRSKGAPMPGALVKSDRASLEAELKAGAHANGFQCPLAYSAQVAFNVIFDSAGTVVAVDDAPTMANLLDTRKP
jgi:hypothetical protein